MSIVSDRAKGKQLYAQIEQLMQQAGNIYTSVKHDRNADYRTAVSQLEQIYDQIKQLADQIPMNRDTITGKDRNSAYRSLEALKKQIDELKALANQQDREGMPQGEGLEAFQDNQNLGSLMNSLSAMFPSPYTGSDPQQAALFDLYMQLLGNQQQYAWQRSADDLAYQRTNFNTLLNQYMAAGMSRSAALAAASGGLPSVSGSSVGGSLSPNTLGAVSQAQNNAVANGQLGVAQQNADTQLVGTMGQLHQMQQQYELERDAQNVALWSDRKKQSAYEQMQRTFELTYSLHANHVDVPLEATISQKTFKDWLRDGADTYDKIMAEMNAGHLQWELDGTKLIYWDADVETMTGYITRQDITAAKCCKELYEEIQKHVGSQEYGILFENLFMSNAGPRAYHQQEDYSYLQQHLIAGQTALAKVDELMASLADDQVVADVNNQISQFLLTSPKDDPHYLRITQRLNELGLVIENGQICLPYPATNADTGAEETHFKPLTLDELMQYNLVNFGFDIDSLMNARAALQAAALQTDWTHYKRVFQTQANMDRAAKAQTGTQASAIENAAIAIRNKKILNKFNEWDVIWKECGFQKIAMGAATLGVGLFKVGTALKAGQRANAMIKLGEMKVQAQQDMAYQTELRNRSNRNTQYSVNDFDMPY